jgi:ABC-type glycerol-3-phosphate transport system substrate-binding protein
MKALRCAILLLPLALLLVACGATFSAQQSATPLDYTSFVEHLRADGATVEPVGDASAYPLVTHLGV